VASSLKIAFTGGGTGGHIYPALAIARMLKEKHNVDIFYIGADKGMDRSIVEGASFRFYGISSGKLRRYFSLKNISDIFKIIKGYFAAKKILKIEKPALLFSKGGFVSVPPVIAASRLKIPVWTHESDFSPGLATKINACFAARIYTAYEKTALFFKEDLRARILCSGNPVRSEFREADGEKGRAFLGVKGNKKILLVLGGSQGAKEINDLVALCLPELTSSFFVVHQTGNSAVSPASGHEQDYLPIPYIKNEMPDVLASASLVIGRSGAGTVWESAAIGVPMILVPLSGSGTRGDQVENARYFSGQGAAIMLIHPTPEVLLQELHSLIHDEKRWTSMAALSKAAGEKNAAQTISEDIVLFSRSL
jgi:UDP-N-acetylglucosamine--N-acetylmuramyl-(pentapeptide) pyrophosphoryl-undecaprenol N-acetylglucosamine transferase